MRLSLITVQRKMLIHFFKKWEYQTLKTKEYLKNLKRKIYVDEFDMERPSVPVMLKAIRLHSKFSTQYYRFNSR